MAPHSSISAWEIPRAEGPGGLQSMGLQRDTTEQAGTHAQTHSPLWSRKALWKMGLQVPVLHQKKAGGPGPKGIPAGSPQRLAVPASQALLTLLQRAGAP